MRPGVEALAARVREEHATWDDPLVCREIFGTVDPDAIAASIGDLCERVLGSAPRGARFYRVSVGCVAGLDLEDGRAVVVKVQRGARRAVYLDACAAVRAHLADRGFPCPRALAPAHPLAACIATFEELLDAGERGDAHEPSVRRAVASSLAELVRGAAPFATDPAFGPTWFTGVAPERVFPRPHSPLFDFEATAAGAGWIDDLARQARARRDEAPGARVIGHFDWRVEHLRFAEGRVVASYDWDSLHADREAILVGATAHGFTADWSRRDVIPVPTLDEMRAFVADYEAARGAAFEPSERRVVAGSLVYSLAYTARCCHAVGDRAERPDGDFRPVLAAHGEEILDRF